MLAPPSNLGILILAWSILRYADLHRSNCWWFSSAEAVGRLLSKTFNPKMLVFRVYVHCTEGYVIWFLRWLSTVKSHVFFSNFDLFNLHVCCFFYNWQKLWPARLWASLGGPSHLAQARLGALWLTCAIQYGDGWKPIKLHGYGSIPIDTFLVGWTSIYQLFWCSLGTRVLTHPHMKLP